MMVMLTQRTASQVSHGEIALVVMGQRVCAGQRKTRAQYCDAALNIAMMIAFLMSASSLLAATPERMRR
jgi:hypothetical protein